MAVLLNGDGDWIARSQVAALTADEETFRAALATTPPAPERVGNIILMPPASWDENAADLLERALYLRSMDIDDATLTEKAITDLLDSRTSAHKGHQVDSNDFCNDCMAFVDVLATPPAQPLPTVDIEAFTEALRVELNRPGHRAGEYRELAESIVREYLSRLSEARDE